MAWVAVGADGAAHIFEHKPFRVATYWISHASYVQITYRVVYRLTGIHMLWHDEPVEV